MDFDDFYVRAPTQQELTISERVVSYNSGDVDKVARIEERGVNLTSRKLIIVVSTIIVQISLKRHPRKVTALLETYIVLVYLKQTFVT